MEVLNDKNKITITIDKNLDKFIYQRLSFRKDLNKFIEYLFDLDFQLNGDDDELGCYEVSEIYEEENKDKNLEELYSIKESLLKDISTYIDYLDDAIPSEYKIGFYGPEPELVNIPVNDTAMYLKMLSERIKIISKLIKTKENKNNARN